MKKRRGNNPGTSISSRLGILSVLLFLLIIYSFVTRSSASNTPSADSLFNDPIASESSSFAVIPHVKADTPTEDYCLTVPVLLYHHVQPLYLADEHDQENLSVGIEFFDMQMNYLVESGYTAISADQLVTALHNRDELPAKSVVITFDDGYEDNYLYAYPILRKYNLVGNIMVSTGLVGKDGYVTWEQLEEMAESNLIHIYNHTASHKDVGNASADVAREEIYSAHETLLHKLGIDQSIFAYPYGSASDSAREILQEFGYTGAFTTQHGFKQCASTIYDLHRNHIGNAPLSLYGF